MDLVDVCRIQRRSEETEIDLGTMGRGDGVFMEAGFGVSRQWDNDIRPIKAPKTEKRKRVPTYCKTSLGSPYFEYTSALAWVYP